MRISKDPATRKAELVAAARALFDEKGVDKTRVSDIVKRVGVAQGVFYYYFESKDEIVDVVIQQVAGEVRARRDGILAGAEGFATKVAEYIGLYVDWIDVFLSDEADALTITLFADNALAAEGHRLLAEGWIQLVRQGAQSGELSTPYPEQTAKVLLYGLEQLCSEALPELAVLYHIAEQSLCLEKGSVSGLARSRKNG